MTDGDDGASPGTGHGRRWDVALSFAGAQRDYVGQVAAALKALGVRCFYDADEEVELWGTHLSEELPRIFAQESAVVVVFISADHVGQGWTRLERRAAFSRAVAEAGVYVLPARFDDSDLPGLLPDVVTVDLRRYTPVQFADLVAERLARLAVSPLGALRAEKWSGAAGRPLVQVSDPFALEVHRPVQPEDAPAGLPVLPVYVPRGHDQALARVVRAAAGGRSGVAVLVGGSSTGKTRACWEALGLLRDQEPGWRVWHPIDPSRPDAALADLPRIGPQTVVWLNEAQFYLDVADGGMGERVAAGLRELLRDPARSPVLVLATLWPQYWDTLTARPPGGPDPHAQARELLAGHDITVPAAFTPDQMAGLAGSGDARLVLAARSADGQVTQFLAGAPELLSRYRNAPPAAAALISAAMDARRLGMGIGLPHAFLEHAAPGYLTDAEWDAIGEDWLEQALTYAAVPGKGVRAPLARIRPRPAASRASGSGPPGSGAKPENDPATIGAGPLYRLADYLDEIGRRHRADLVPPRSFWAAAIHATPGDTVMLADAARARGLLRDAARLYVHATERDGCTADRSRSYSGCAAVNVVRLMDTLCPGDPHPGRWAATYCSLVDPYDINELLRSTDPDTITALLARNPASRIALDRPWPVERLLARLDGLGARDQVNTLLARDPAAHVDASDRYGLADLLPTLHRLGAADQVDNLARRAAATVTFRFLHRNSVFAALTAAGARDHAATLAARAAAEVSFTDDDAPEAVACVLYELRALGATDAIRALLARNPAEHLRDGEGGLELLAEALKQVHADEQIAALNTRMSAMADTGDPSALARMLSMLHTTKASDRIPELLNRIPAARVDLRHPIGLAHLLGTLTTSHASAYVANLLSRNPAAHVTVESADVLLRQLRRLGADEQYETLAQRIAREFPLQDPKRLRRLLSALRFIESSVTRVVVPNPVPHLDLLLARDPAGQIDLANIYEVAGLISDLREIGAEDASAQLASRAAIGAPLDNPSGVALLLKTLPAGDLTARLLTRAPATHAPISYDENHIRYDVLFLAQQLRAAGAVTQADYLLRRLVAAGHFSDFCRNLDDDESLDDFRWGREPDGKPAEPWNWDDAIQDIAE